MPLQLREPRPHRRRVAPLHHRREDLQLPARRPRREAEHDARALPLRLQRQHALAEEVPLDVLEPDQASGHHLSRPRHHPHRLVLARWPHGDFHEPADPVRRQAATDLRPPVRRPPGRRPLRLGDQRLVHLVEGSVDPRLDHDIDARARQREADRAREHCGHHHDPEPEKPCAGHLLLPSPGSLDANR